MPPRTRATAEPPAPYAYPGADKRNAPTSETAARMTPEQVAELPIPAPEPDYDARVRIPGLVWNRQPPPDHARTYGPLYVHDKVSPAQFVNTLLKDNPQSDLFAAFNGFRKPDGTPADDAGWFPYEYRGHWTNRLIRATGQRAMASLLYKDNLRSQVNLIYMDPPYNISFRSNFQVAADSPESGDTLDSIPKDPIAIRAFRDTYRNDVHSYLDGIHEQLILGRELLADSGSFIIQIGPDNLHQVAMLMGEVFGQNNHVATVPYRTGNTQGKFLGQVGNWLVWYAKDINQTKYRQLYSEASSLSDAISIMGSAAQYEAPDGSRRGLKKAERENPALLPKEGRLFRTYPLVSEHESKTRSETFYLHDGGQPCQPHRKAWDNHECTLDCDQGDTQMNCPVGKKCGPECHATAYPCPTGKHWTVSLRGLQSNADQNRLHGKKYLTWVRYSNELAGRPLDAFWQDGGIVLNPNYIVETPTRVLERCLLMTTDPGDLVLDLTCGSGAMPVTAETWGRRWIACDVAAVSIAIARERIATGAYPGHLLKDSPAGAAAEHELAQELLPPSRRAPFAPPPGGYGHDPALGFVNERQLRVSAATLAYGPKPDGSDIIYHPDRTRQDRRRRRVAAAFTVESDSPYRAIAPSAAGQPDADAAADAAAAVDDIEQSLQSAGFTLPDGDNAVTRRIVSSLETAGIGQPISETARNRYRVENLQPAELPDVTHTATLVAPDGSRHRAHFYIGAEDEIISALKTGYAAQSAAETRGVNYLVMVGFGRDEDALPVARKYPRLNILQVEAHRDLQLPHLKESAADHAFTIISEPEIRLTRQDDGKVTLSVLGMNAFNPRTGMVEPPNTRQVMCIMTDTAYDGESFRVRLMNVRRVTRNQKTLSDLRKALDQGRQKQVDGDKWAAMQTTTTVPFDLPAPGVKIAVKVIDQTGTEHMAVLDDPHDRQWY